jgi:hypothetical protein
MSTRAVYSFIEGDESYHVYYHFDGYPSGAAQWIENALRFAWETPRFEIDEFAAAFVAGNKVEHGGGIRLIAAPISMPANKAARSKTGDLAFRYEIRCVQGKIRVTAFSTIYWDKLKETKIWEGPLEDMPKWAKEFEKAEA